MSPEESRARNGGLVTMRAPAAARYLKLSKSTLAKWRLVGKGPKFIRAGRAIVYSRMHLDEWLEANAFRSTAEADRANETRVTIRAGWGRQR